MVVVAVPVVVAHADRLLYYTAHTKDTSTVVVRQSHYVSSSSSSMVIGLLGSVGFDSDRGRKKLPILVCFGPLRCGGAEAFCLGVGVKKLVMLVCLGGAGVLSRHTELRRLVLVCLAGV